MARQQSDSVILYDGVSAPTIVVQEAGTAGSYVIGDLVKFDDAGQIQLATNGVIAGIAQMDSTASAGSAGDTQFMELINWNALYTITAASATSCAQANVGEVAAITFTYSAQYATPGAGELHILGIYPGDVDVNGGRYIVRFNPSDVTLTGD